MANLYTGTHTFTGYKTLAELTELTFTADTKYTVQVIAVNSAFYAREGTEGKGFISYDSFPFTWTYDGENDLYIGSDYEKPIYINISE